MIAEIQPEVLARRPDVFFGLLQEDLLDDPWRMLVACLMLNRTTRKQVDRVIWEFFRRWPDAESASSMDLAEAEQLLRPLGFGKTRSAKLKRMSTEYQAGQWKDVTELHGVGQYAADSWRMLVERDSSVEPQDKELKRFKEWQECRQNSSRNTGQTKTVIQQAV